MTPRPIAQWTEIFEQLRAEHGAKLTAKHLAERILGDFIGYEHPTGNVATRARREARKVHDVAELANALKAGVALLAGTVPEPVTEGHFTATEGPGMNGKPSWYGLYKCRGQWAYVLNVAGNRICYMTKEAAEAGAKLKLAEAAHSHALDVAIAGRV